MSSQQSLIGKIIRENNMELIPKLSYVQFYIHIESAKTVCRLAIQNSVLGGGLATFDEALKCFVSF